MQSGKRTERRIDRLFEKCRLEGFDSLSERESAELFLCLTASSSKEELIFRARAAEDPFAFFSYSHEKLCGYGASETEAFLIEQFPAIAERIMRSSRAFTSSERDAGAQRVELESIIMSRFIGIYTECVLLMFFDNSFRLNKIIFLSDKKTSSVVLDVGRICRMACNYGAKYILLAHNHPSGISLPSSQDCETTQRLFSELRELGIWLVDHYIVTRTQCRSIKETYDFTNSSAERLQGIRKKLDEEYDKYSKRSKSGNM